MAGYPTILTRAAFGPTREDDGIAPDDARYVGAYHFNLLFHQVAGMNILSPRAYLLLVSDGDDLSIVEQGEAWAPDGGGAAPSYSSPGAGEFEFTYASSYTDQRGGSIATAFRFAATFVQGPGKDVEAYANVDASIARKLVLNTTNSAGALTEPANGTRILLLGY